MIRYKVKEDVEKIVDLVESYEDMVNYQTILLQNNPSLKMVQSISNRPMNGVCVPIACNDQYAYYIQYQHVVKQPSS